MDSRVRVRARVEGGRSHPPRTAGGFPQL